MAEKVPIRAVYNGSDTCGLSELRDGEVVGVEHGGLGACTFTADGVLLGNTQGAVQVSSALTTNGQLLIGGTSGPAVANVTGTSNEVEITSGDGSITIGLPSTVCVATKVISPALCITSQYVLPSADGSAGQVMCTDGSGALAFATNTPASPGGSDTYVQFNDGSSFGGSANFTWDDTTLKATNFCTAGTATLATVDINAGAIDGTTIGAASAAAITGAALTATGNVSFDGGTFIFNESGADKDFRVEGDTDANLFMADASTDRIGIGTATPSHLLDVDGVAHVATCLITPKVCITSQYVLPAADGSAGQILCTDGSGTTSFAAAASSGHTIAEDGSTLASRTCLNFCGSAVTVTDCSATDSTDVKVDATGACMPIRVSAGTQCYACLATATIAAPCLQCDSAPKLGGSLDVNGNSIISASNGNIPITPNGSGIVIIDGLCHPIADGSAGQLLCTDGSAALKFATAASSGHTIANAGSVLASRTCLNFVGTAVTATDNSGTDATDVTICATNAFLPVREADGTACCVTLATAAIGECLQSDTSPKLGGSLDVNGNSIVSDAGNENIPITPHGTGSVVISKADINGGAIDGTIIGAASAAAITGTTITGTTLDASGDVSFDGGTFVFNESGADKDFRIEGDTAANLFIADASTDRIGIGTATPSHLLDIEGVGHAATCFVSAEVCATTKVSSPAICVYGGGFASGYVLPAADGSAGQLMCTNGSGAITFATAAAGVTLAGSTNNTIATVTGANALAGEANLTFDGSTLTVAGALSATGNISFDGGSFVFNESGADKDFRIEGDTDANLFVADASTDRIGIGTATPGAKLQIVQANNDYVTRVTSATDGDYKAQLSIEGEVGIFKLWADGSASGDDPGITLNGSTGIGIGTAAPAAKLHVCQTTAGAYAGRFDNNQTDGPTVYLKIVLINHTGGTSDTNSVLRVDAAGTNAFEVKSNGNVGVNTFSPDHQFEVENTMCGGGAGVNYFAGNFKTTVATYNIQAEGTHGGVTGTAIVAYQNSSSPADGDFAAAYVADYKDSGGNRVQVGSSGWFVTDVTAGTRDSYFYLRVYNNNSAVAGTLSTAGVWTDSSAAVNKEYYGTRQEVWPDGVLDSLKTLNVSKYKQANLPDSKIITETHVSPTAEDFWDTFQIGQDPRRELLNAEGEQILNPSIAPKDLSGMALVAIQELLDRVEAAEAKIAVLESA